MALGSTQPLTEMSTRNLADNLTAICEPIVYKCGSLDVSQRCGPSRPFTGRALPYLTLRWTLTFRYLRGGMKAPELRLLQRAYSRQVPEPLHSGLAASSCQVSDFRFVHFSTKVEMCPIKYTPARNAVFSVSYRRRKSTARSHCYQHTLRTVYLWLYNPLVEPLPIFQFLNPMHSRYRSLDERSASRKAAAYTQDSTNTQ
jgi:hypothetical protein